MISPGIAVFPILRPRVVLIGPSSTLSCTYVSDEWTRVCTALYYARGNLGVCHVAPDRPCHSKGSSRKRGVQNTLRNLAVRHPHILNEDSGEVYWDRYRTLDSALALKRF